jgi:hypothetical protein
MSSYYPIVLCALLAAAQGTCRAAEEQAPPSTKPNARENAVLITVDAKVQSIDYDTREVTLKGPLGNEVSFTVDKKVKRLNEFKVGDIVEAEYFVSIAAELRAPTEEEKKEPISVGGAVGKAPSDSAPGAGAVRQFKVVTTVEGLDAPTQTVTVKGPRGRYLTARLNDSDSLRRMRIGDTVVLTYTEALAVSLKKVEKEKKSSE